MKAETYTPEWGIKLDVAGYGTITATGKAGDALAALRAVLDANGQIDPFTLDRIEVFRIRDIGGPEA